MNAPPAAPTSGLSPTQRRDHVRDDAGIRKAFPIGTAFGNFVNQFKERRISRLF